MPFPEQMTRPRGELTRRAGVFCCKRASQNVSEGEYRRPGRFGLEAGSRTRRSAG
jgi:hypothetical protein